MYVFVVKFAAPLVESLNHSFSVGVLSTSQRQSVITLINKKGRDERLRDLSLSCGHEDCIQSSGTENEGDSMIIGGSIRTIDDLGWDFICS